MLEFLDLDALQLCDTVLPREHGYAWLAVSCVGTLKSHAK